jgi:amidase
MGYIGWIGTFQGKKDDPRMGTYESEMVRELRALGAILYCKTSVPHSLMSGETLNNIIGYTWNPKNRNLCSGGSSGGEGALIGLKGSPAGFGTDIGGSIRIPAGFNGLFGIRPSGGRMPYEGMANSMDGQNSILSVVGPLATTIGSLKYVFKSILSQSPWLYDPLVVELPWREEQEKETQKLASSGKLTFGVLKTDGVITPQPPVARAIQIVADTIDTLGHKIVEWKPPSHQRGFDIAFKSWIYDGGADIHSAFALSGEPISKQISMTYGEKPSKEFTASEIAATNVAKREYQKEYMDYWNSTAKMTESGQPVDAFIMPLAPYAAARPEKYLYYGYSGVINGLDYTSVVIPVTLADRSIDVAEKSFKAISDADQQAHDDYDADIYDGAHVSVQLVGRRFQEEKTMALAEYIAGAMKK